MRTRTFWLALVLALGVGGGCVDEEARQKAINLRTQERVEKWVVENPATPLTMGQREYERVQAVIEVDKVIKEAQSAARTEATTKALEAASHAASGNWIAAALAGGAALLLLLGLKKPEGGKA